MLAMMRRRVDLEEEREFGDYDDEDGKSWSATGRGKGRFVRGQNEDAVDGDGSDGEEGRSQAKRSDGRSPRMKEKRRKKKEFVRGSRKNHDKPWLNVQVGSRKVKVKVAKAAKTVQGDIDAAKEKREKRIRQQQLEEERKRLKSAESRRIMRRQFERKMVQRKMDRRREMEEVQLGVKQEVLYGRKAKANLHQGTFHERQAKMLRMHLQAETVAKKKGRNNCCGLSLLLNSSKRGMFL